MISGRVTGLGRAIVRLLVEGSTGSTLFADAAVDTGFNGLLALPSEAIAVLRLRCKGTTKTTLANGAGAAVRVFPAIVQWHGQRREVDAVEVRGGALIGMSLLKGSRLTVDVVVNGPVRIEPIA